MTTQHKPGYIIHGPLHTSAPLERLDVFFEHNNYTKTTSKPTQRNYTRGVQGSGWWTSNMTELHTILSVVWDEKHEQLKLDYRIDASGQRLSKSDRAFWSGEVEAARDYLLGKVDTPKNLQRHESARAKKREQQTWAQGIIGAIIAGVLAAVLYLTLLSLGYLKL